MPKWTREQALFYAQKGKETRQRRLAEWNALRSEAFGIIRQRELARKDSPTLLDELTRKLITLLLSAPAGPRAERMAKIIELITRAQRNLSDAKPPQPPAPSTDSADFRPIG